MASLAPPVDPSRALVRVEQRLPARRPSRALVALGTRALPVLAATVTAAVATLATERALRRLVHRAPALTPPQPLEARRAGAPAEGGRMVVTEFFMVERIVGRSRRLR